VQAALPVIEFWRDTTREIAEAAAPAPEGRCEEPSECEVVIEYEDRRHTPAPGGVVDRVVKLSNGEYEVHNIGVNWPHHIFVNQTFKVVGAD
jgi:hypothetical protein